MSKCQKSVGNFDTLTRGPAGGHNLIYCPAHSGTPQGRDARVTQTETLLSAEIVNVKNANVTALGGGLDAERMMKNFFPCTIITKSQGQLKPPSSSAFHACAQRGILGLGALCTRIQLHRPLAHAAISAGVCAPPRATLQPLLASSPRDAMSLARHTAARSLLAGILHGDISRSATDRDGTLAHHRPFSSAHQRSHSPHARHLLAAAIKPRCTCASYALAAQQQAPPSPHLLARSMLLSAQRPCRS